MNAETREIGKSMIALLLAELMADGDGATIDARKGLTSIREKACVVVGADEIPRLVLL